MRSSELDPRLSLRATRSLLGALGCAAVLALGTVAHAGEAEDRAEAKRLYAEARRLRAGGDADAALELFRRAHELAPTPVTRLELARELEARRRLVEARALAARVAELPRTPTETQKSDVARREALALVAELEPRIATLVLDLPTDTAELELLVDGTALDAAGARAPMALDPGEHRVIARRGAEIVDLPFALVEGERRELTVRLPTPEPAPPPPPSVPPVAAPPPSAPVAPPPSAPSREPASSGPDFGPTVPIALTLAGLGLATGAVTGSIALAQKSELEASCPALQCPPDAHGLLAAHEALTTTSTIAFVVGGVAAATGVVLWAVEGDEAPDRAPPSGASLELRWLGTGLALEGTWSL